MISCEGWAGEAVGVFQLWGSGWGAGATLVEREELHTWSRGAVGFACGLQRMLELEHFWN